jgi:hypothetical protein
LKSTYRKKRNDFDLFVLLRRYDTDKDKSLNFNELKFMMEKLGIPQTHLNLKEMIQRVDEDHDGKISFREVNKNNWLCLIDYFLCVKFLLIFRKAMWEKNEIENEKSSILYQLYAMLFEIDVSKEGVCGAKNFFEAKVTIYFSKSLFLFDDYFQATAVKESEKFHREIREEQEQRRRYEEEKIRRKLEFQNRLAQFQL